MDIECIITPSMVRLRALDIDGRFNTHDALSARLSQLSAIYDDCIVTPDEVASKHCGYVELDGHLSPTPASSGWYFFQM